MVHLLLIGGGEIGAPREDGTYRPLETLEIDKHFVAGLNKANPNILFIPTATEQLDPKRTYEQGMRSLYRDKLHCKIDTLYFSENPTPTIIKEKLAAADAIYVGGGDTNYMMQTWRQKGFDELITKEVYSGKPVAGLSAGAMCWFDKVVIKNGESKFTEGLKILSGFCIPHWNKHKNFLEEKIAKNTSFLAIDECAALEIIDNEMKIITSKPGAGIYVCQSTPELKIKKLVSNKPINKFLFERNGNSL